MSASLSLKLLSGVKPMKPVNGRVPRNWIDMNKLLKRIGVHVDTGIVLNAFRAELDGKGFYVGFGCRDPTGVEEYTPIARAVIERIRMETNGGSVYIVEMDDPDIELSDLPLKVVERMYDFINSDLGQNLMLIFKDSISYDAAAAPLMRAHLSPTQPFYEPTSQAT